MLYNFIEFTRNVQPYHSERLALRPLTLSDAWPLWEASQNDLFNKHLMWDKPTDPGQVFNRVQAILAAAERNEVTALSAVLRETGEWVSLFRFQHENRQLPSRPLETGIWTHSKFWAGGYSLELARLLMSAAFEELDVDCLVAKAAEENRAVRALFTSVGLSQVRVDHVPHEDGKDRALLVYQVTRSDWLQMDKNHQRFAA